MCLWVECLIGMTAVLELLELVEAGLRLWRHSVSLLVGFWCLCWWCAGPPYLGETQGLDLSWWVSGSPYLAER